MKASLIGWLVAAILGAALALTGQRLLGSGAPEPTPTADPTPAPPPPPAPVDPAPARALAVKALVEAGVPHGAIRHGVYPLRGPGRAPAETLPLVAFDCPADGGCGPVIAALDAAAGPAGLTLVGPVGGDRPGRPIFRALSAGERPALALRAQPAGPRLTVIVGDVGRAPALVDAALALDPDVTLAVAADATDSAQVARRLAEAGREVLAHLPLTAEDGSADGLGPATARLVERVPGAVGAAAPSGGALLSSGPHASTLLGALGDEGLFFVDRPPTSGSVAGPTARARGVRATAATHDLDADPGTPIATRLKAIEVSLVLDGHAVVTIGADPAALAALQPWLETLRDRRVRLLRASEVVR